MESALSFGQLRKRAVKKSVMESVFSFMPRRNLTSNLHAFVINDSERFCDDEVSKGVCF